jgi:hypothetical protein
VRLKDEESYYTLRGIEEVRVEEKIAEEIIRLLWRGQCGRAAAGSAALSLRCAASTSANVYTGYA